MDVVDFAGKVGLLPYELAQILNQTYFLHLLATEPEIVIPDGKSLLSMMAHSRLKPQATPQPVAQLHERVENAVHAAFWSQALETLSDPTPSVQIARLKGLLFDLREAISPLFPPNHPIIATLSAPIPPTASPLISTNLLLKDILVALRQRAAPVRDATIDGLLANLDAPLSPIVPSSPSSSIKATTSRLARLVIDTMKSIMTLVDTMKADLNQFVLGSMTETQLNNVVVQQAKKREKELTLDIWGDSGKDGTERVQTLWQTWVDELQEQQPSEPRDKWIRRLVQSLGSSIAVSCSIPGSQEESVHDRNQLPPQFFFTAPRLLYAQNYLQALVVAASLRSLTRLPPLLQTDSKGHDFMDRIWALLKAEIDEEDPSASTTKVINFADEVVRARRSVSAPDETEETQLRAAVDRTLQYGDPVFLLLQKRLLAALAEQLCRPRVISDSIINHAPERMQTGRTLSTHRADKRPRLEVEESSSLPAQPLAKGFEDPVLVRGIEEIVAKIHIYIRWVEDLWKM
ncbi:hypothetical protein MSAN_00037100 [Mycena sanguinolenta]|uniref:Uncharacterized protein n=1 Tax=Mycena sanguinolenta TaxID=230812 RepID=A0A8H6ZIL3_9AGAR|nr:hypothetical protein MSAN_00037100 [Mycena sanguinolenta]